MILVIANRRRFLLLSLILLAVTISLVSAVLFQEKISQEKEEKASREVEEKAPNPFSGLKSSTNFSYVGSDLALPPEAVLYEMPDKPLSLEEIGKLVDSFGFTGIKPTEIEDRIDGRILFWDSQEATIHLRLRQKVIKYSIKKLRLTAQTEALGFEQAKESVREFLNVRGLFQNLSFRTQYEYIRGLEVDPRAAGVSEAEGIRIGLNYTLGDWPILDDFLGPEPVSAVVRNDGQVVSLSYLIFRTTDLVESNRLTFKSFTEAKAALQKGEGLGVGVLRADPGRLGSVPYSNLLNQVHLSYFRSLRTGTVQPVFVFESNAARVLVPAFKGQ